MDSAQLSALIDTLPSCRVAVVGDAVADEFVYGRVARVSREAPVLILEYDSTEIVPGGAGNAANNVAALGGTALLVTRIGRDEPGRRLLAALHRRVDPRFIVRQARVDTPVKTRILAGGVHSAKQQVVRIDRIGAAPVTAATRAAFIAAATRAALASDAVLVSDYGGGLVSPAVVTAILIGDRSALDDATTRRLQAAGTYHVIAISGGNVAVLVVAVLMLLQPWSRHRRGTLLVTLLVVLAFGGIVVTAADRKSTRLNSSHGYISYAVFCL